LSNVVLNFKRNARNKNEKNRRNGREQNSRVDVAKLREAQEVRLQKLKEERRKKEEEEWKKQEEERIAEDALQAEREALERTNRKQKKNKQDDGMMNDTRGWLRGFMVGW